MQHERPASFTGAVPGGTAAGIAIASCALATIFVIAHHPTVSAHAPADAMEAMVRVATADRIVHGVLIAIMAVLLFGFTIFALRRGLHRWTSIAGLIAFAGGIAALVGAALVDGFLTPAIAERYAGAPPDAVKTAIQLLLVGALAIQILSKLGIVAMSAGVVLWSVDLLASPGILRTAGVIGVASGIVTVAVLAFAGHLNPHSLGAVVTIQAVWYLAVAVLLLRRLV